MYAFYSLLVYIFYTVFKKEEEEEEALEGAHGGSSDVRLLNPDQTEGEGGNVGNGTLACCWENVEFQQGACLVSCRSACRNDN